MLTEETTKRRPRLNRMIELFEAQIPALGIFVLNIGSRGAAAMASSALDFVIIEMEHTPFDPAKLEAYLLAMTDKRRILEKASLQPDVVPLVRIRERPGADGVPGEAGARPRGFRRRGAARE